MPLKAKQPKKAKSAVQLADKLAAEFCKLHDLPLLSGQELDAYCNEKGFEESLDWLRFQYFVTFQWPSFKKTALRPRSEHD
jgi:hypothetical protein